MFGGRSRGFPILNKISEDSEADGLWTTEQLHGKFQKRVCRCASGHLRPAGDGGGSSKGESREVDGAFGGRRCHSGGREGHLFSDLAGNVGRPVGPSQTTPG